MRTVIIFLFVLFVSMGAMLSAIYSGKDITSNTLLGMGLWVLFGVYAYRKSRRNRIRRENEEMFHAYMRDKMKSRY